jgi:hypothetical protein
MYWTLELASYLSDAPWPLHLKSIETIHQHYLALTFRWFEHI